MTVSSITKATKKATAKKAVAKKPATKKAVAKKPAAKKATAKPKKSAGKLAAVSKKAARTEIHCTNPATGEVLGTLPIHTPEDVTRALVAARKAQRSWGQVPFAERRKVLARLLDRLLADADDLVELICRDSGKTRENALLGEVWPIADKLTWTMRHGEKYLKDEVVSAGMFLHKKASIQYPPLGVIGVITPWNYPLQNIFGPVIPALFAGNAVIIKVSEQVAWSSQRFQAIFDDVLGETGYPKELVQIVQGYAETGRALVKSGVDKIVFTGSVPNGRSIIADSAETITPVILELGGKDSLLVCDDAHIEQAVHATMSGVFINCGQNCLAAERVLVYDSVYDDYVNRLVEVSAPLRQGPPLVGGTGNVDCGAIVSPYQVDLIEGLVNAAVAEGARVLVGGKRMLTETGQYFAPTILADVTPDMTIMNEEVFGPVVCLCRVRDDEEAIEITNGTSFGLGVTIMSKSRKRADALQRRIEVGNVSINDFGFTYMAQELPFGGAKDSGFGRLNGREGLRAMTNVKAVLEDRLPLHMPAKLYPVGKMDYAMARGVIRTLYGRGVSGRLSGLAETAKVAFAKLSGKER